MTFDQISDLGIVAWLAMAAYEYKFKLVISFVC